jgi:hypothetical protein
MPFQLPERPATLVFEDGPLEGLELEVRLAVPFDFYFELSAFQQPSETNGKHKLSMNEQLVRAHKELEESRHSMHRFAEVALIGWNLVDRDGTPVPCTPQAFSSHVDPQSYGAMLGRYLSAIGGKPGPLRPPSSAGRTSRVPKASNSPKNS